MIRSRHLLLLAATMTLALAAACGGDDSDGSATASATGSATGSATATAAANGGGRDDGGSRGDSSGGSAGDVERDVLAMLNAAFGDEPDVAEFARHFPEECPQDVGELTLGLALAQAFLGEADIEFEVSDVEFIEDDRALVTVTGTGGFLDLFGDISDESDADSQDLWVLQDGVWRSTSDCAPFDEERSALGLSATTDEPEDFGGTFGEDFGPPVAAAIGQPLQVGDLTVTINGASLSSEALNDFDDPPLGVLVVVDFTFANDGQEPTSPWWALTMELYDDRDRTWETSGLPFDDVGPGFSQDFQVSWDVPLDATGFRVVVSADPFVDLPLPDDFAPWEVPLGEVN